MDIKQAFEKEPLAKRRVLLAAAVVFVATFFPWYSVEMGFMGGFSYSAWSGCGMLTVFASFAILAIWILPLFKVKFKLPLPALQIQKILAVAMLAGPVLWIIQKGFHFAHIGLGLWIALIASIVAVRISFKK
ncbi:hypothetical protein KKF38_03765 [Patescibacteria group bacterium]|nr:hypothetical protein [Patescibacteria group bacterium]